MTLSGIDVSAAGQGVFNWAPYRGKVSFAFAKISESTDYADPDAARNIAQMRAMGITVGGYHFLHAGVSGAVQAGWFMAHAKAALMEKGDIIAVDVEQFGLDGLPLARLWEEASDFASVIHSHFAAWPLAYSTISFAADAPATELADCPLWLANPSGTAVKSIGPWTGGPSFEQTGQRGVDTDVFYGTAAQLAKLTIPH